MWLICASYSAHQPPNSMLHSYAAQYAPLASQEHTQLIGCLIAACHATIAHQMQHILHQQAIIIVAASFDQWRNKVALFPLAAANNILAARQ